MLFHFQSGFQAAVSPDAADIADIIVNEFPAGRNVDFVAGPSNSTAGLVLFSRPSLII
jgi:hypothetical protein